MGFFDQLKKITNNVFGSGFTEADENFFDELEESLILADVGMETATDAVEELRQIVKRDNLRDAEEIRWTLRVILEGQMSVGSPELDLKPSPAVILFVGVNGVGKTTSIGKLAYYLRRRKRKKVLLCAADTFRAAAGEQLEIWAQRASCDIIRQKEGTDPGAVLFDMGFSQQEYWSGLPFSPPGDLPNPGIEPTSPMSPALAGGFCTTSATWEAPPLFSVTSNSG